MKKVVCIRITAFFLMFFFAIVFDAGLRYFFTEMNYAALLFNIIIRVLLASILWLFVFMVLKTVYLILGASVSVNFILIVDFMFTGAYIVSVFHLYYFGGQGSESMTSIATSRGVMVSNGKFTLLGLHDALLNIANATFFALLMHLSILIHTIKYISNDDLSNGDR